LFDAEATPEWLESTAASTVAVTGATTKVRPIAEDDHGCRIAS